MSPSPTPTSVPVVQRAARRSRRDDTTTVFTTGRRPRRGGRATVLGAARHAITPVPSDGHANAEGRLSQPADADAFDEVFPGLDGSSDEVLIDIDIEVAETPHGAYAAATPSGLDEDATRPFAHARARASAPQPVPPVAAPAVAAPPVTAPAVTTPAIADPLPWPSVPEGSPPPAPAVPPPVVSAPAWPAVPSSSPSPSPKPSAPPAVGAPAWPDPAQGPVPAAGSVMSGAAGPSRRMLWWAFALACLSTAGYLALPPRSGRVAERIATDAVQVPNAPLVRAPAAGISPVVEAAGRPVAEPPDAAAPLAAAATTDAPLATPGPKDAAPPVSRRRGYVAVSHRDGWAEVRLKGRILGETPGRFRLRAGVHRLEIRPTEGDPYTRVVRVQPRETTRLVLP